MFSPIIAIGEDMTGQDEPTSLTELLYRVADISPTVEDKPQITIVNDAYILPHQAIIYEAPISVGFVTSKVIPLPGDKGVRYPGQCVAWVKYYANVDYSGNAIEWLQYKNSDTPHIGDIIILSLSYWGHVGIVTEVTNTEVTYRSRNLLGLWIVSDSTIARDDPAILGYIIN